ncbi:hypothetical protein FOXG_22209 [Fusarium oxysporum f. sp. lycopersici 4287]|uniref:Uncharacterized protein n=1 Tax=Fusarium oxysporum f. sp. lycopersici (strain 4287 / CBS 123668 / FGSC 9935 / NRRL 34936) TaxID=426428 RepID=A0A0J9W656_FUSO4|nr:hypothetical protein FOXG_22076 [Fusarium oxysporum f. sp. lycopersici 4287]XP_018256413.1 uncharacterized protein FOXG_22209 [Fusarium oxysporum f. sp. lycopersici 4287]KNB17859.1 hypothetical protein FOXG_22076 [Fusarium oxysporum f. sp. lycopersici 4287]KNB18368.1 hypothetical protein FOXG_22209 [Fusarium oxysporum f. sp. lycopersici 4287]
MEKPLKLSINIAKEFRFTTEKRQAHDFGYYWAVEVATPTETPSSVTRVLRDIVVAIRACFLKLRGLVRFKLVLDEEKQGLLEGG